MKKWLFGIGLIAVAAVAHAQPTIFDFFQPGFSEGAVVSGFFVAEDLDGDGRISTLGEVTEVSDFQLSFSGNSRVPAFSLGPDDLEGLVYVLDGGPLGDDSDPVDEFREGIRARAGNLLYVIGPGPDQFAGIVCGEGVDCSSVSSGESVDFSAELMRVTERRPALPVPIPAWSWLVLALLLGTLGWRAAGLNR